jgi:hypothetical protein
VTAPTPAGDMTPAKFQFGDRVRHASMGAGTVVRVYAFMWSVGDYNVLVRWDAKQIVEFGPRDDNRVSAVRASMLQRAEVNG